MEYNQQMKNVFAGLKGRLKGLAMMEQGKSAARWDGSCLHHGNAMIGRGVM
ncbi:hypothetical protein K4A85_13595 [Bacillus pumilus]|nr:hypothetical protein K4A85_13595 [Bacillus pumilus]WOP21063.1 hypothetical protein R0I01_13910 [Bacillus pumilus]